MRRHPCDPECASLAHRRTVDPAVLEEALSTLCLLSHRSFGGASEFHHSGEESLEGFDGSLFAYPEKAGDAQIDLIDQGEYL